MLRGAALEMPHEEAVTSSVEEGKQAPEQSVVSRETLGQIQPGMALEMSEDWRRRREPGYRGQ